MVEGIVSAANGCINRSLPFGPRIASVDCREPSCESTILLHNANPVWENVGAPRLYRTVGRSVKTGSHGNERRRRRMFAVSGGSAQGVIAFKRITVRELWHSS